MCALFNAITLEQSIDGWLLATETLIEFHGCFCATLRENVVAETLGNLRVEDAFFLEERKRVSV